MSLLFPVVRIGFWDASDFIAVFVWLRIDELFAFGQ